MTLSGGRIGHWANRSGVRNSLAALTDRAVVLPNLGEKFEITGRHAEGATCEVFKAHHVALDLAVAIKVLKREHAFDPRFAERMRIEAQVLPRLKNRHIVQCFDRGVTSDDRPYTVLEFLRGETLDVILERAGRLDERAVIDVGIALLDALETTHSRGVVHRDVSLRNLIVHRTEHDPATLKLIDFGFALILPTAPESAPEPAEFSERDIVGTPRFASPEVALARSDIDPRADLYSAGAVLYTLLAGRDPFAHLDTPAAVLEAHAHHSIPPLTHHTPHVSPALQSVITRLLAKDRTQRYATAQDARLALVQAGKVAQRSTSKPNTVPPSSRTHLNSSLSEPRPSDTASRKPRTSRDDSLAPTIHLLDQNHCVARWCNMLVHVCRGTLTVDTIERMNDVAREVLRTRMSLVVVSIIETTSPTPRDSVRPRYAAFFREIAPFTAANLVLVDGGQFRASTVQSVGAALTHSARERIPFEFVRTVEEASSLIGPHLPVERRDEKNVRQVLEHIRARAASGPSKPSSEQTGSSEQAPVPSHRGSCVKSTRAWIIAKYGLEAWEAGLDALPAEHRGLFACEPISVIWYPLAPWTIVLDTIRERARLVHGESAATFDREQMYACASLTMTNVYRVVFRLFSPRTIVAQVSPYLNRVFSHGEHDVVENEDGRCILRFRDAPLEMRREIERSFPLAAEWMLDLARQEVTHSELVPTLHDGTYSCQLTLTYRPRSNELHKARGTQPSSLGLHVKSASR